MGRSLGQRESLSVAIAILGIQFLQLRDQRKDMLDAESGAPCPAYNKQTFFFLAESLSEIFTHSSRFIFFCEGGNGVICVFQQIQIF